MGAAESKTALDVVNQSIVDCVIENINNCSIAASQNQEVNFSGIGLFTSSKQSMTLNLSCLQEVQVNNDLLTQMSQKIIQESQAQSVALLPSYSGSNAVSNLTNYLSTKITTSTIQNCALNAVQLQKVNFSGLQVGSTASQTIDIFSTCMQKALNNNKVSQGIVQDVSQKSSAKVENPLDFLGNLFSGMIVWIILIIVLIAIAWLWFGGSGGSAEPTIIQQQLYPMMQQMQALT